MIKEYKNGNDFIKENSSFLDENKYMSSLFYLDAELLKETNTKNYALRADMFDKRLLVVKVEPWNLLLYGDKECLPELLEFLKNKQYEVSGFMCSTVIGDYLLEINKDYKKEIGMDFMESKEKIEESSTEVTKLKEEDADEVLDLTIAFFKDCGLNDKTNKETILRSIDRFFAIKRDNKIISMAAYSKDTENSKRITYVYTRPEYRGNGYARKVVNFVKNEILSKGKIATLNVDQNNPISYHLYTSLGFKKVFSQAIYVRKEEA